MQIDIYNLFAFLIAYTYLGFIYWLFRHGGRKMALLQNQKREEPGRAQGRLGKAYLSATPAIIALLVTLIAVVLLRVWGAR